MSGATRAGTHNHAPQIAMGTFIISFIGNSFVQTAMPMRAVQALQPNPGSRRRMLVLIYFFGIIAFVVLFGVMTIPVGASLGACRGLAAPSASLRAPPDVGMGMCWSCPGWHAGAAVRNGSPCPRPLARTNATTH